MLRPYPLRIIPIDGESLPGFIHRLAQRNGFATVAWVRSDIGLGVYQVQWDKENFRRLAAISGQQEERLRALDVPMGPTKDSVAYGGSMIDKRMLERYVMRYCPECLAEEGHHQAIWLLRFVTACPKHCLRLIDRCPSCGLALAWSRPKFLECKCGARLPVGPTTSPSSNVSTAVDGVRLLYESCGVDHGGQRLLGRLPDAIRALDLQELAIFLWFIGSTRDDFATHQSRMGSLRAPDPNAHLVLQHAYEMASDWPLSFHRWLERTGKIPRREGQTRGLQKQFPRLTRKLQSLRCRPVLQILQDALLGFAQANGIYIHHQQTLFISKGAGSTVRMIPLSEMAKILGVSGTTAMKIAYDQGWLDPATRQRREIKVVPEHLVRRLAQDYDSKRDAGLDTLRAARRLNLNQDNLIRLLKAGVIGRPRNKRHGQKGAIGWLITEQDVAAFQDRLEAAIQPTANVDADQLIPLFTIAGGKYLHGLDYTALIQAVLRGELVPRGRKASVRGVAGLLFDPIEAIRYCARRSADGRGHITIHQAAKLTGLPYSHILAAVHHGLLEAHRNSGKQRSTYRLSLEDVEKFGNAFTTPGKLAAEYSRTPRFIIAALSAVGIEPILSKPPGFNGVSLYASEHLSGWDLCRLFQEHQTYRDLRKIRKKP